MNRLATGTFILLVSNAGSAVLSFLLSILIGRLLGETGLGTYAAALAWIFPLSLIAEAGLNTLITRDVAQQPAQAHAYLLTTTRLRLVIGTGLVLLLLVIAPFLTQDAAVIQGLWLSSPLILTLSFYGSFTAIFRANQVMQPIALLNTGMLLAQVSLTVLVLGTGHGIMAVFVINTATSAGQLVAAWLIYRRFFYQKSEQRISLRPLVRQAYPFAVAAILAAVQSRLLLILLEQFAGTGAAGYFVAAYRFIDAGRMLPHALFDALFPLLSELVTMPSRLNRTFRRVTVGLLVYGAGLAVTGGLLAEPIIALTYGSAFQVSASVLMILVVALLPLLLKQVRILYHFACQNEHYVNRVTFLVLVIQVYLAVQWLPDGGAVAAAWIVLLTEFLAMLLMWLSSGTKHQQT